MCWLLRPLHIPRHDADPETAPKGEGSPSPELCAGDETILVVEDEPAILEIITTILADQGYHVITAATPTEAIRLTREHAGRIHLLLTNLVMPEMNGRELAQILSDLRPGLKRLFMSGYTADTIATHGILEENVNFIQKPFSMGDLTEKARRALDR